MGPGPGISCAVRLNSALTEEQKRLFQDRTGIERILDEHRVVAIVGCSTDPRKASSFVAGYLLNEGYTVVPVNPTAKTILGQEVYARLADIPFPVDVVDVFRPAAECDELATQAIAIGAKAFWQQLRIT
ncbi:MAG TPA: CoA-binding protein, partial [Spirochaetia bacterium]|nr:CoA-binding protein [Spirochaetia bacterium]